MLAEKAQRAHTYITMTHSTLPLVIRSVAFSALLLSLGVPDYSFCCADEVVTFSLVPHRVQVQRHRHLLGRDEAKPERPTRYPRFLSDDEDGATSDYVAPPADQVAGLFQGYGVSSSSVLSIGRAFRTRLRSLLYSHPPSPFGEILSFFTDPLR